MTDLSRNGSVLVAEIKAIHPPQGANGAAAVPGTATDGGAAPAVDPSITSPQASQISNGHAPQASELSAGTGAIAVNHSADPSVATGVAVPATVPESAPIAPAAAQPDHAAAAAAGAGAGASAAPGLVQPQTTPIQPIQPSEAALQPAHINTAVPAAGAAAPASAAPSALSAAGTAPGTAPGSVISATSPVSAGQAPVQPQAAPVAAVNSGISDPYELYKHIHPSKVGSCIGSGMGGMTSLSKMFRDRRNDNDVQKDILQETFINSVAGWVNLLVMSSAGPIKTVVGACATALQSIDVAVETILSGKAELMLAGGFDDLSEEGSFEFANMKATSNGKEELAAGREPSEHSRPFSTSRSGFMESQGCGVQVLTTAANAIKLGMPIQGIVAYSNTHTDGAGRSLPAPGHGVISSADGMQRALARFNLTADDIGVISAHMTATKANDKNESHVYQELFTRMGRTPGHAVPVMAQKWLCGHAKGGAAAWALNGVMQSLHTSIVCGNRNADDISPELQKFDMLLYNSTSIHRTPHHVNAAAVSSFGFGQVGGIILVLHAAHILGRLSPKVFEGYVERRKARQHHTYTRMHSALTKEDLVRIKDNRPWPAEMEDQVLMNLNARAVEMGDSYGFKAPLPPMPALATTEDVIVPAKSAEVAAQQESLQKMMGHVAGVGIDCEKISTFPSDNDSFVSRNFTDVEIEYCRAQPDAKASFCGRFCAAEAVFKSLGVRSQGSGASLKDVEIVPTPEGPQVKLYGEALKAAHGSRFLVSISHGDDTAMAIVHRLPSA